MWFGQGSYVNFQLLDIVVNSFLLYEDFMTKISKLMYSNQNGPNYLLNVVLYPGSVRDEIFPRSRKTQKIHVLKNCSRPIKNLKFCIYAQKSPNFMEIMSLEAGLPHFWFF